MTFKTISTALVLVGLAIAPTTLATPVMAQEGPMTRGQCLRIDPENTTERCRQLHRAALFQAQMAETGATDEEQPILLAPYV